MTSKYAEQINEIAETVARIDERTLGTNKRLDKLNSSQTRQWEEINENKSDIKVLNSRISIFAGVQMAISTGLAAVAAWLGMRK